ncbi:hypothetical protein QZH41_009779, partial [Actinostola sp. cb2023]
TALSANLVYMDSVIWEGGFGAMDRNDNVTTSPTSKTVYPCASLTKILTALMLFKLHSNGKVPSIDVPITNYEPEFAVRNPFHRNITFKIFSKNTIISLKTEQPERIYWSIVQNALQYMANGNVADELRDFMAEQRAFNGHMINLLSDQDVSSVKRRKKGRLPVDLTSNVRVTFKNLYGSELTAGWDLNKRHLAAQRSGLQREAPCYPSTENNFCPYNYSTMLQRISKLTLLRRPGTEPQYSNLGWSLLGQILAKHFGGGDYKTWMKKALLEPLGMSSSSFTLTRSQISKIPVVYTNATSSYEIMDWGWLAPSGGLYSSVHDLAQMEIKLFSEDFLDSEVTEEFFKEDFVFPDGVTMTGMPWEIKFHNGRMIREKIAYVYGYNSYVGAVPEMKLAFNFMCTNCIQGLDDSLQKYLRKIISTMDNAIQIASPKKYHLPPDTQPYIGVFNADHDDNLPIPLHLEVRLNNNDKLAISINNGALDIFFMNYIEPRVFTLHLNPRSPCDKLFTFGVEEDLVLFDRPSSPDGLSGGFTMYSAHPSGRTHFARR